ncbi:MAG TPA: GNAT family N-acetyltransferase [Rubrobacteraceae bacterium]|nr:GNAT family N-acetyltransferase [Rubrobacteraceae bacterium]
MTQDDVPAAYRAGSIALTESAEEAERARNRSAEEVARREARYRHALEHDPGGAWVAVDGDRVAGAALALVREGVWILSLLAVDEAYRNAGVGRDLLDHALRYAAGCEGAMIAASTHPAALRRYALAGFTLLPTLMASGTIRREALPADPSVRDGEKQDLELATEVDRKLRGAAHGPDLELMLRAGARLFVAEGPAGRGYAVEYEGHPAIVAATAPEVAGDLLWACLAECTGETEVRWLTGSQDWAVRVALDAGLSLSPQGPVCVRGELGPLTPYLPSGAFL